MVEIRIMFGKSSDNLEFLKKIARCEKVSLQACKSENIIKFFMIDIMRNILRMYPINISVFF